MAEEAVTKAVTEAATLSAPETPAPDVYIAIGRRKTAVARVRLKPNGTGEIKINRKRSVDGYFEREQDRAMFLSAFEATSTGKKFDCFVNLDGGGTAGQAAAAKLGIARALCKVSKDYELVLRGQGFLTRDSREKERRKYGRRGARARFQFSKR